MRAKSVAILALLMPGVLAAGQARYARLGELEGQVEVQLDPAGAWQPGRRNLPLPESAWIRTSSGARAEIELDEGSAVRLGPESLLELSDLVKLSTDQRITVVSLDRGLAYLTGAAEDNDSLVIAVPGAEVSLRQRAAVRVAARETVSEAAVLEGRPRFSSPEVELDLKAGQLIRIEPSSSGRFYLYNEVPAYETDRWSQGRDRALAATGSAGHVPGLRGGLADLDAAGAWIQSPEFGAVWKPNEQAGWAPFRNGKWVWYDGLGYTWISNDQWGWLPYHYGRWMRMAPLGWFWVPGKDGIFSPGEAYWVRGKDFAGWGPLAPGEEWIPQSRPQLYTRATTTFARFNAGDLEIDPAASPLEVKDPLAVAVFVAALPSPPLPVARLHARRPLLRAGSTRVRPVIPGVTYGSGSNAVSAAAATQPVPPPAVLEQTIVPAPAQPPVIVVTQPAAQPEEVYYPVPVYSGIVVVNPPDRDGHRHHERPPSPPPANKPPEPPKPAAQTPVPRGDTQAAGARRPSPPPTPPASTPAPAPAPHNVQAPPQESKPVPRGDTSTKDTDRASPRRQ
jgi:hypothetical protein